jgi:hypothetical protein
MIATLALAALLSSPVGYAPDVTYDPRIPTLQAVVGHDFGERISSPDQIVTYLRALAAADPGRTRLVEYARSWEGRPLLALVVASADRIGRLDAVKGDLRRLASGAVSGAEADRLVRELPVVVALMHAVHGNEISSSDAALAEAYHLLAAQDAATALVLREAVVVIDPLQNPDGRARFLAQNATGAAATPDPEPASAEHDEPWPGGRGNHYLFDMNRDWFAQTQLETQGRLRLLLDLPPHVAVDLHEMGGESTYFFAPPAPPLNPHITERQNAELDRFGRAIAGRFDARGFPYFIRENYDAFYPGYGESWPTFQGAIGMTFEQASARGLAYRRRDDSLLTYGQGVLQHLTAALATAEAAAAERESLLRGYLAERRAAATRTAPTWVLSQPHDPSRAARLAALLVSQGIEVRRAEESFAVGARQVPAGAWLVPGAQAAGALARTLLETDVPMPEEFVREQDRRRRKRLGDEIYDVTAWSLPLVFDVEVLEAAKAPAVRSTPFGEVRPAADVKPAKVAWLLPWGSGTAAATGELLRRGVKVRSAGDWLEVGDRRYETGTAIVRVAENGADVAHVLAEVASRHGIEVVSLDTGWVEDGISLGSSELRSLRAPRVLLAWDLPASSMSAGWARWVLERRFEQPVTAVRTRSLPRIDLRRYDVLVLPSGDYKDAVTPAEMRRLKEWVRAGGVLVTVGEASRWAAREYTELLSTRTELRGGAPEKDAPAPPKKDDDAPKKGEPFDLEKALQPERERPESTPGALLRVRLDREHWLAAGNDEEIQAVVDGPRVFTPIRLDEGTNVGLYAKKDRLVASGLAWPEAQEQLAQKAYLIHQPLGDGHLVAFAEDPNFRGYAEATELLFMNAVLLGPAY